jgi:hypothetical protein
MPVVVTPAGEYFTCENSDCDNFDKPFLAITNIVEVPIDQARFGRIKGVSEE